MPRFNGIPEASERKPRFNGLPDKPQVSTLADMAKSAGAGLAEGVIGVGGMIGDANELAGRGAGWLLGKIAGGNPTPEQLEQIAAVRRGPLGLAPPATSADIKHTVEGVTGDFYEPQTTAGEYARTVGQFTPAAALGPARTVPAIVADVVAPAVASETAGQFFKGSPIEPAARFAGALAGNLASVGGQVYANADNLVAARAARGIAPDEYAEAQRLQDTANRIGVPLSGPEAIQEATGGATKLADVQRVVEGSLTGGERTARFYADRPQRVRNATNTALDTIAPQASDPSTLGPRAARAATGALDDVRQRINTATQPAYRAAEKALLDPADFEPIARDPAFQASLRRLRSDEVLGPVYADMPDNSVAVIDAVTKDMRDRGVALGNAANPGFSSQAAGMYGSGAAEARAIARDPNRGGVQAYDDALTMQEQARRQNLEPLEQGPLGRIAGASDTAGAYNQVLPTKPSVGQTDEVIDAIIRLAQQDGDLPPALVRQSLADTFDASSRRLATGENQSLGGRFANAIAGTPQQDETLRAVIEAINRPEAPQAMADLINILRTTSQRRPMGSPTEPNRIINDTLDQVSAPLTAAAAVPTAGTSVFREIRDRIRLAARDRAHASLADLFTAPDSVVRIRQLGAQPTGREMFGAALARQGLQEPALN